MDNLFDDNSDTETKVDVYKRQSYILVNRLNLMQIFYRKMLLKVRLHGQLTVVI